MTRIFGHALEDSQSKSALVHSLSVCISLLDPKRSVPSSVMYSFRNQNVYEPPIRANPETVGAMLPKLGELIVIFYLVILMSCYVGIIYLIAWPPNLYPIYLWVLHNPKEKGDSLGFLCLLFFAAILLTNDHMDVCKKFLDFNFQHVLSGNVCFGL